MAFSKNNYLRQQLIARYNGARANLLIIAVLTAVNVLLLVTQTNTYFLFSAAIPYVMVDIAMFLCGMYPAEFYVGEFADMLFFDEGLFVVAMVFAVIFILLYLLSFFLSKKAKYGWMVFALTFFSIDTAVMLVYYGLDLTMIIDYAFHVGAIIVFSMGINACLKLKNLPEDVVVTETGEAGVLNAEQSRPNSLALRHADFSVKAKTLLEIEALGKKITYRRVKKTNELVIDGSVYDEYIAVIEHSHMLRAFIDGNDIIVGYDGVNSYIMINGQVIVKKLRLI